MTRWNLADSRWFVQARKLDQMIEVGYQKSKEAGVFARIDNSTDFHGKLERATAAVVDMLND